MTFRLYSPAANVYGPGQQLYRIIPRTILSARSGKNAASWGRSINKIFIHIKDVVTATLKLAEEAEPGQRGIYPPENVAA